MAPVSGGFDAQTGHARGGARGGGRCRPDGRDVTGHVIVNAGQADSAAHAFGKVYALSAATGTKLWSFTTGNEVFSSAAVANGVVYIGSTDGKVYALSAATGTRLWSYTIGAVIFES